MIFTTPPNKSFVKDIQILQEAIKNNENISFSKFCDGEWAVMCNQNINNKEFWFDPQRERDQIKRKALIDAFQYKNDRYFVGITCVKVFGLQTHNAMKHLSNQAEDHLTWADIWVNSNYKYYVENVLPLFNKKRVVIFCNEKGKIDHLPFKPSIVISVKNNAWEYNWNLIEETKLLISTENITDHIFLFCCGPFGNILCHKLTEYEPRNTYLDIGSTLNPWLQSAGFERDYYMSDNFFSRMIGAWG